MDATETPTSFSRILHGQAKDMRDRLTHNGYSLEITYLVMLNALARLAFETGGEAGLDKLQHLLQSGMWREGVGR